MSKRIKKMPLQKYEDVLKRNWTPVELLGNARPEWMRNIPPDVLHSVYASGSSISISKSNMYPLPAGDLIGGIDVYRNDPDDPVKINKDWYAVISDAQHDNMLLVAGPYKDNEHWIDEIPERLKGAEVLAVPPKTK